MNGFEGVGGEVLPPVSELEPATDLVICEGDLSAEIGVMSEAEGLLLSSLLEEAVAVSACNQRIRDLRAEAAHEADVSERYVLDIRRRAQGLGKTARAVIPQELTPILGAAFFAPKAMPEAV